jgi:hypothetical protein
MASSPRWHHAHDGIILKIASSSRWLHPHDGVILTMASSPRLRHPHDGIIPTMAPSPRWRHPHDGIILTIASSSRRHHPHDGAILTWSAHLSILTMPSYFAPVLHSLRLAPLPSRIDGKPSYFASFQARGPVDARSPFSEISTPPKQNRWKAFVLCLFPGTGSRRLS